MNAYRIAEVLQKHQPVHRHWVMFTECTCGQWTSLTSAFVGHQAAEIESALSLTREQRTLADGMGGVSTNYKTGETTVHSKPCTRQQRWVTPWETADPLLATCEPIRFCADYRHPHGCQEPAR